jgi:beta-glucosidase
MVGIAHNMIDWMPERPLHLIDRLLAILVDRFYNWAWVDAIRGRTQRFGIPFLIPRVAQVPEALNRVTADYIGLNYYTKGYLRFRPQVVNAQTSVDVPIGLSFAKRKEPMSDMGWAIHPKGMRKLMRKLYSRMRLPIYITENGIADHEDLLRGVYLFTHLQEVARAISEGIEVLGYYHWSLLDNFEWIKGFKPRFGLFRVDYDTMARTKTGSADLYAKIIRSHLTADYLRPSPEYFGI